MFARLAAELERRAAEDRPVRVGLVGAGRFGTTVAAQVGRMRGLRLAAVADVRLANAQAALGAAGWAEDDVQTAAGPGDTRDRVHAGVPVMVEDAAVLAAAPLDVLVEATGRPEVSARVIPAALESGIHVVNVTVESDVLIGALFRRGADAAGVVYTLADGDQPGCTKRLYDWAIGLGYRVIAAGRGTRRHAGDRTGTPDEAFARFDYSAELVRERRLNPQMYNSFRDGSKAQIEATAIANMTGLVPDVRGLHEPSAALADLPNLFRQRDEGGILGQEGVVELANAVGSDGQTLLPGHIASGVWAVISSDQPLLQQDLAFYGLPTSDDGRAAVLSRDYHLCGIEAPWSIVEAAIGGYPTGTPQPTPVADVIAVAKRDLSPGERLDGSGGVTVYGQIERAEVARAQRLLPLGLAADITTQQPIPQDTALTYDMVSLQDDSEALRRRREQDALWTPAL